VSKIAEIKDAVATLTPMERHELMCWLEQEQAGYGDLPERALTEIGDEAFQMLDREEAQRDQHGQSSSR
jgi:hypothetical protein